MNKIRRRILLLLLPLLGIAVGQGFHPAGAATPPPRSLPVAGEPLCISHLPAGLPAICIPEPL